MTKVPSFTFAGGVLSKALWGRYDLQKYQTGLKKANNAFLSVEGGVVKRWGTYLVGKRKSQSLSQRAKLIPWRIADDDSYILEFGDECIRFIRFGGYVSIPFGHVHDPDNMAANVDGVMELESPWTFDKVNNLKYTFANDVMTVAGGGEFPQLIRRIGLYDWEIVQEDFNPHPNWSGTITATYHDDTTEDDNYIVEPVPTKYKVSATLSDGTETKPSSVESVNADLGHRRTRVELNWPDYPDAVQYTIFKGANGIFGFIGYSNTSDFVDRNFAPSFDVVPIGASIPFGGFQPPRVVEYYKQRLAYAATFGKPQDIWFSRPLIFGSLTKSVPLQDDDAFKISLVGRQRHTIQHMVMLKKFIIFTDSSEWTMQTVDNQALTAATTDPVIETSYGAHPTLRPLVIGNRIVFVQNKTGAVLDMGYEYTADAFKADDLTRLTRDIFQNNPIVAWDYAPHPHNLLFCVLQDGTLGIMTYVREHEIWGWTTASTDGKFLDVACVSEIDEDGVYFQVERKFGNTTTYFIERFAVNKTNFLDDMIFTDCSLTYEVSGNVLLTWNNSQQVTLSSDFTLWLEGEVLRFEHNGDIYFGKIVDLAGGGDFPVVIPEQPTVEFPQELSGTTVKLLQAKTVITNLDHLEGRNVWVLADGKVFKDFVVDDGKITLQKPAFRVHVGIPYQTRIEPLDIDIDAVKAQFRQKTVHEITLNLKDSRGVYVGVENADYDLDSVLPRHSTTNMYLANELLNGAYDLSPHIQWGTSTEIVIESRDPLPLHVLNIAPDIRYG